jgi:RNA polymerase sigma factor (sigma-70 family)
MGEPVIELDAEQAALRRRDANWVRQCLAGDQRAFGQLYDAWFDRVFDLVHRVVRDRDVAAEVAQEAFFAAWRNLGTLEKPDAFGGWLLRIARNGAYNRNQKEQRSYAVDDQGLTVIESVGASPTGAPSGFGVEDRLGRAVTPGAAVEDAEIVSLVWEAAEALPERDVEVLDLQLRHGLTPAEIGDVMGMNRNAANQLVHRLKGRLETAIRARVLWRGGSPSCDVLAQRLRDLGIERFSAEAVKVAERHVPGCVECDERQRIGLEPAALFAAVPLFAVPLAIKQTAAVALAASGVPMGGSAFVAAAGIAGQAAGGAGSIAGHAVDPSLGSNVGHAVSGSGVDPSLGSNVGHAIGDPGSPLGSQVGSSLHGPSGSSAPGSTLGDAAGQSIAPPTPIESAASYAGNVAAAEMAAESAASIAGPPGPPAPIPPPPPPGSGSGSSARSAWMIGAAAAVVLVLLFAAGMWWGGQGDDPELVASGSPVSAQGSLPGQTTTLAPGTTGAETTTVPGETTTSNPGDPTSSTTPTPTSAGGSPTTQATPPPTTNTNTDPTTTPTTTRNNPTTTTTKPTTTTTAPPIVNIDLTNAMKNTNGWYMSGRSVASAPPPVLSWSVTPAAGFTVEVVGPTPKLTPYSPVSAPALISSDATGSYAVCPGYVLRVTRCQNLDVGLYTFTITVRNGDGQVVGEPLSAVLNVEAVQIL